MHYRKSNRTRCVCLRKTSKNKIRKWSLMPTSSQMENYAHNEMTNVLHHHNQNYSNDHTRKSKTRLEHKGRLSKQHTEETSLNIYMKKHIPNYSNSIRFYNQLLIISRVYRKIYCYRIFSKPLGVHNEYTN